MQPPCPTLHIHLLGCPDPVSPAGPYSYKQHEIPTLHFGSGRPSPLTISFEETIANLSELDNLFTEPDGSFVWSGNPLTETWQVDGMLYDHADRVQWCEVKGGCPLPSWRQLLGCFDWPIQPMVAHFVEEQFFVSVDELEILWR